MRIFEFVSFRSHIAINAGPRRVACLFAGMLVFLTPLTITAVPGDLDTNFNGTGKVVTDSNGGVTGVAIQKDGKIVVGGYGWNGSNNEFSVVRYNTNGSSDTGFNITGKVMTPVGDASDIRGVAIQADWKIVATGRAYLGTTSFFAVVRYNMDGSLDTNFNDTGKVITSLGTNGGSSCVAIQQDGKIVAGGTLYNGVDTSFGVLRYNTDGTLDTNFNGTGKVSTDFGVVEEALSCVAIQGDGKIVVGGGASNGSDLDFAVVRYNGNGSLDTNFNGTGWVRTAIGSGYDKCIDITVQVDGKIVAVGQTYNDSQSDFAVTRYNADGSLDTNFNATGKVATDFGFGDDGGGTVLIQDDGKIVVAGAAYDGTNSHAAVARYNTNGTLDTSFNSIGRVIVPFGGGSDSRGAALQGDGKIVASGRVWTNGQYNFGTVRLLGDDAEIAVEQPAGRNLVDGSATIAFGCALTNGAASHVFSIKNLGSGSLTGLGISFDGGSASDFSVTSYPVFPVAGPAGSTIFTVRFAPTTVGSKAAALHIASNDSDENPFDINLTGRGLAPDADEDDDGMTNEAELNLAASGLPFDPLVDDSSYRVALHENALGIGLYRSSDMQTLALGSPLLERDPSTGHFHLTIGFEESQDLRAWSPLTGYAPTYDLIDGTLDIEITPDGSNPQFFKVIGKKP